MKITLRGKSNVYEQIVNEYKRYIELGIIKKDEKMPSCRTLGKELGINPNTVVKAYSVLESEGYIVSLPKKGAYVTYDKDNVNKPNCSLQNVNVNNNQKEIESYLQNIKNDISYEDIINIINNIYGRN